MPRRSDDSYLDGHEPTNGENRFFSGEPFSESERRIMRRMLADADDLERERDQLRNMLEAYKLAGRLGRAAWIIGAWVVGAVITLLGILTALRSIGWWRDGGA